MTLKLDLLTICDSPVGRRDARWKLAALLPAAAIVACLRTVPAAGAALAGAVLLALLAHLPLSWYLSRLGQIVPFLLVFTIWLPFLMRDSGPGWDMGRVHISWHGLCLALVLGAKALAILTLMLVWLASTPIPQALQAAYALHVPGILVQLAVLTYRYVFLLGHEFARIRIALRVRGYRNRARLHSYRTIGHVAGTLLVRSAEQAERVGQAMRCRGFDGRYRSLATFRTSVADLVFFIMTVGSAAALSIWDVLAQLAGGGHSV
jgi:cobalt/nickel transport system permease protein